MSITKISTSTRRHVNGYGALRSVLEAARQEAGCGLSDLTVLSAQVDPYRLDTRAGHRDGAWLAAELDRAFGSNRRTHWRGLHYAIVARGNARKPDGAIYRNTEADWLWLSGEAGKAARWLGYVPFDRITDNRNAEPLIYRKARVTPEAWVSVGFEVSIPDAADIAPTPAATGFEGRQAYQFAIFGEKGSLEEVLLPLAKRHEADLYLPSGEISDTLVHQIAKDGAKDGRPLVVFTLSDFDPAGHQMPISIARKLQAFRDLLFPHLRFDVAPIALLTEQVRELGLPSTPLKETEKRADRWRGAFGVEQTEIDALATLQPHVLREIVDSAFDPYLDRTLNDRVKQAEENWIATAQDVVDRNVDDAILSEIRDQAAVRLEELREEIERINDRLRLAAADHFTLPEIEVPTPEIDAAAARQALVSTDQDWVAVTRTLIRHKAYGGTAP